MKASITPIMKASIIKAPIMMVGTDLFQRCRLSMVKPFTFSQDKEVRHTHTIMHATLGHISHEGGELRVEKRRPA